MISIFKDSPILSKELDVLRKFAELSNNHHHKILEYFITNKDSLCLFVGPSRSHL